MSGMPSRGGLPDRISENGTECLAKSVGSQPNVNLIGALLGSGVGIGVFRGSGVGDTSSVTLGCNFSFSSTVCVGVTGPDCAGTGVDGTGVGGIGVGGGAASPEPAARRRRLESLAFRRPDKLKGRMSTQLRQ